MDLTKSCGKEWFESVRCSVMSDFLQFQTVDCQTPLSMEFSRQEYWSGLPFPSPGDLPDPGIEPGSPTLQADPSLSEPPGKPISRTGVHICLLLKYCSSGQLSYRNKCTEVSSLSKKLHLETMPSRLKVSLLLHPDH